MARRVVGPDEPFDNRLQADMEDRSQADHWMALAATLRRQGVVVGAEELKRLPHDVELTDRLRARLSDWSPTDYQ